MVGWSETRLADAETCGLHYHLKYVKKLPDPPGDGALLGRLVHEILADYSKHCLQKRVPEDWALWDSLVASVRSHRLFSQAEPILARIRETVQLPVPTDGHPWAVEQKLAFRKTHDRWKPLDDFFDRMAWWRAVVDLYYVDEQEKGTVLVVRDWKSQIVLPSQSELENSPQLKRYAYCLSVLHPEVEHFYIDFFYVRYGVSRSRKLTLEEIQDVPQDIERRVKAVEKAGPKPRVSSACDWCNFTSRCPAYQQAKEFRPEPIRDTEKAEQTAQAYLLLKRRLKDLEEQLKGWVAAEGPIPVGDLWLGYKDEAQNECLDPQAAFAYLVDNLIPAQTSEETYKKMLAEIWQAAVSISPSSAERAMKKILGSTRNKQVKEQVDQLKEGLKAYFQDLRKSVFKARKAA